MGGVHLHALREVAGATLAAVFSNDERQLSGDLTATQGNLGRPGERLDFSGIKVYRDIDAVLGDSDIDAVDLCLPTFLHEDVAVAALRAGKHVLVEKPMALEGATARRIIAEAERAGQNPDVRAGAAFLPPVRGAAKCDARTRRGARRLFPPALRRARMGWMAEGPCKERRRRFRPIDPRRGYVPPSFRQSPEAVSAVGLCDTAASLDILHGQLFYPFGTVVVSGGWQHEGAFPFGMEYSVTLDGGTVEYNSAGRPPTLFAQTEQALPLEGRDGYAAEIEYFVECCRTGGNPIGVLRGNRRSQ